MAPLEAVACRLEYVMALVVVVLAVVSLVAILITNGPTTLWIDAGSFTARQLGLHLFRPLRLRICSTTLGFRVFF